LRCGGRCNCRRCDTGCEVTVELFTGCLELTQLELGHSKPAPAFGGTDQRGVHQLEKGTFAEGIRDDLGAPTFFAEQSLKQVRNGYKNLGADVWLRFR
jgi:hypothetical protein